MCEKQKILHVITVPFVINHFFGKQFVYLKSINKCEYHLACTSSAEFLELANTLDYIPLQVDITRSINIFKDIKAIYTIYNYIKLHKIDKVVGHTPKGGMIGMIASFLARSRVRIYFRHGIVFETCSGLKRIMLINIDRISGNLATKVVCVSESVRQISINSKLNKPDKNILLGIGTCNGIDSRYKFNRDNINPDLITELKFKWNILDEDKIVGYVGRLVKDKGIDDLLCAWGIVLKSFPRAKLLLVGPIEKRDPISNKSKQRILDDQSIIHVGSVSDASPYYSLMDVFILPTYREGFSTVVLEASSMELPVLVTRATGCTESILENQTGLFIRHEIEDIANKIVYYLERPLIAKKHGKRGREFVSENFEQHKIWNLISSKLDI